MSASTERKNRAAARAAGTDKKMLAAQEAEQKARKSKRKWTVGVVAVILFIALVLVLSSPMMYRITTAETVCGVDYSPAEVKYIRGSSKMSLAGYGYDAIASTYGIDLADQLLENDVNSKLLRNSALVQYAKEQGISLDSAEQNATREAAKTQMDYLRGAAQTNGVSLSTVMSYYFGAGVNESVIRSCMNGSNLAGKASFTKYCQLQYSPEELAAYYEDPADADLFSYTSFLVKAEEGADPAEAKTAAEALVMGFTDLNDGEVEPQVLFSDLVAEEYPDQAPTPRSGVTGAQLDETLRGWLTDPARKSGDITALEAADGSGWNVVLFLERSENTEEVVAVRHILVKAEATEDGVYTDEAKAAAKEKAEKILADFQSGDQSEASFALYALLYSEDTGSSENGGLYSTVTAGQTVEEFDKFCFADHAYGDTAIVYGETGNPEIGGYAGYHVMFYVEKLPARDAAARDALRSSDMNEWLASLTEAVEPVYHWAYKLVD